MRHRWKIACTAGLLVVALAPAVAANATFPGANGLIVFGSSGDLRVVDAGGATTQLTSTAHAREGIPDWNATSDLIAYSRCGADEFSNCDIWVMDADGGNRTRLTAGNKIDEYPDWSPDGSHISFSRNGNIWVMDAAGVNQTQLTTSKRHEFAPTFSPGGTRIAFNRVDRKGRIGVWTMPADGSAAPRQRTFGPNDFFPDWQPV